LQLYHILWWLNLVLNLCFLQRISGSVSN